GLQQAGSRRRFVRRILRRPGASGPLASRAFDDEPDRSDAGGLVRRAFARRLANAKRKHGGPMNIAIFLPNWVGDVVMATPALRALRQHFPQARIHGICKPYVAGVLEGAPWVDTVMHLDRA